LHAFLTFLAAPSPWAGALKRGFLLVKRVSVLTALGALSAAIMIPATVAGAATSTTSQTAAATRAASPSYSVTAGHASRLNQSPVGVSGLAAETTATSPYLSALRGAPSKSGGASASAATANPGVKALANASHKARSAASAPAASGATVRSAAASAGSTAAAKAAAASPASVPGVAHAFNGVSDKDSDPLFGSPVTPPDQGLCVGTDTTLKGSPDAVWEPVNEAAQETTKSGVKLRSDVGLGTLFQDQYYIGDVRCVYDAPTKSFIFTEIGFPVASGPAADGNNTTIDVAVVNSKGAAEYQFDTSLNSTCFGDQPKTGFDNNALVISTDEYCGPTETDYEGAAVFVISKPQLTAEAATVSDAVLGPVSIAGNPITGLDPAVNTGSGTEYLVDSTSFLGAADNPAPSASTLDLSALTNTASVTTGKGTPELASKTLPSEKYVYPVPATSTGDGSTSTLPDGSVVTSENAIQSDDDRTSGPVNVTPDPSGGIDLWTAVDTAITPRGDTATRDGSAWFEISTAKQKVISQGYTAVKGANLVYPAIEALPHGPVAQVFTITGPTINPSIAYNKLGSPGVTTVQAGSGPHVSFSDTAGGSRWGDYSMAVPDPDGSGIWFATEYIPPAADQDPYDNWGTYVFEVPSK
jgi:hypothetical protein